MSKTARDYLVDLLDYIRKVADFTQEGHSVFMADEKTQFAVIRAYEVIGEIVKRLPPELLETQPEVEWQAIKEFRDFLSHTTTACARISSGVRLRTSLNCGRRWRPCETH